jgi:phosphatidylglycerophosphate synthase
MMRAPLHTWANLLTLCRAGLMVPCVLAISDGRWTSALALFTVAVATDLVDGPLARRLGQASPLGGLFDHATDAAFVTAALGALAAAGLVPWLLPVLVPLAFLQYMLDSRALAGRPLRGSWLGRWNGIGYFVLAGFVLAANALPLELPGPAAWAAGAWLLIASTLTSMTSRAIAWRRALSG